MSGGIRSSSRFGLAKSPGGPVIERAGLVGAFGWLEPSPLRERARLRVEVEHGEPLGHWSGSKAAATMMSRSAGGNSLSLSLLYATLTARRRMSKAELAKDFDNFR